MQVKDALLSRSGYETCCVRGWQRLQGEYSLEKGASLNDPDQLRRALGEELARLNRTLLGECCHQFSPQGVSLALLTTDARVVVHTWPERAVFTLDVTAREQCAQIFERALERLFLGAG